MNHFSNWSTYWNKPKGIFFFQNERQKPQHWTPSCRMHTPDGSTCQNTVTSTATVAALCFTQTQQQKHHFFLILSRTQGNREFSGKLAAYLMWTNGLASAFIKCSWSSLLHWKYRVHPAPSGYPKRQIFCVPSPILQLRYAEPSGRASMGALPSAARAGQLSTTLAEPDLKAADIFWAVGRARAQLPSRPGHQQPFCAGKGKWAKHTHFFIPTSHKRKSSKWQPCVPNFFIIQWAAWTIPPSPETLQRAEALCFISLAGNSPPSSCQLNSAPSFL